MIAFISSIRCRWHVVAGAIALVTAVPADAQQQLRQWRGGGGDVIVDWSVLDNLSVAPSGAREAPTRLNSATARPPRAAATKAPAKATRSASATTTRRPQLRQPDVTSDAAPAVPNAPPSSIAAPPPLPPAPTASNLAPTPPPPSVAARPTPSIPAASPTTSSTPPPPTPPALPPSATIAPPTAPPPPPASVTSTPTQPDTASSQQQAISSQQQAMASPRPSGPVDASLRFDPDRTDLPGSVRTDLRRVVDDLKRNPGARLKIEGYSAVADESGNKARRDSLSRALAVRRFLIEEGIVSTRMDVHALGSRTPEGTPADRVDVTIVRR